MLNVIPAKSSYSLRWSLYDHVHWTSLWD